MLEYENYECLKIGLKLFIFPERVLDSHAPLQTRRRRRGQHDIRHLSDDARKASVLWCCWLVLLTCKTVSRITYTVLVETLNPAQSNPIQAGSHGQGRPLPEAFNKMPVYPWQSQCFSEVFISWQQDLMYTVSQKNCKIIFVRTFSNFNQLWKFLA